jgi:hypothetical protein
VVRVKGITSGSWYLGLKNPSNLSGVYISVEVAAIVEETFIDKSIWSNDSKSYFHKMFYDNLIKNNVDNERARIVADCLINQITIQNTPEQWDNMIEADRRAFLDITIKKCIE